MYMSLSGAYGIDMKAIDGYEDLSGLDLDKENALGFKVRLGSRSSAHFAAEIEVEYFDKFAFEFTGIEVIRNRIFTATANLKPYFLAGRVQPFLVIGGGVTAYKKEDSLGGGFLSENDAGAALKAGAGVDIYLTNNTAIVFDGTYVLPVGDAEDLDYLSLGAGLQYKF
jgi:hypothetical protein